MGPEPEAPVVLPASVHSSFVLLLSSFDFIIGNPMSLSLVLAHSFMVRTHSDNSVEAMVYAIHFVVVNCLILPA